MTGDVAPPELAWIGRRWALPGWVRALLIYATIHGAMLLAFWFAWTLQGPNMSYYSDHEPSFGEFLAISWDGGWYREIAEHGYPAVLPLQPNGDVAQNPWAFYPLFPLIVRVVMLTSLPWTVAGPLVAFALGALAAVLISALVRQAAPAATAARPGLPDLAVAGVAAFPGAGVFNVAYAESTALVFIAASLLLIHRRDYGWAMLTVTALGFARAAALPMVIVVLWHGFRRWKDDRRSGRQWAASTWAWLAGLTAVTVLAGFAWPWITGAVTGRSDAYFATQSAWREGVGSQRPFVVFAARLADWTGDFAMPLVLAASVAVIVISLSPAARMLGPELQAWGGAYLVFLLAAGALSSSAPRFVLLSITVPMAVVAWSRRRWMQVLMVVALLVSQVLWVTTVWVFASGGDAWPP